MDNNNDNQRREEKDKQQAVEGIRRGLQDVETGRTQTLREFDRWMRCKYNIPTNQVIKHKG